MDILCLIPARYNSTRLPGKLLLKINDKTILNYTYDNVLKSKYFNKENVIILCDDQRIIDNVKSFNGKYHKIDDECINGTERIIKYLPYVDKNINIVLNVQGDEPFINPEHIDKCVSTYYKLTLSENKVCVGTTLHSIIKNNNINDTNIVKLVFDIENYILYASRNMIPYNKNREKLDIDYFSHIGIYCFNRNLLDTYFSKSNTKNQLSEDIEMLKFIEYGLKIKSSLVSDSEIGINTQEDYNYLLKKYNLN